MSHACKVTENEMIYIHRETGVKGEEARLILERFINTRMDTLWREHHRSPVPKFASIVVRPPPRPTQPARVPPPRTYSPIDFNEDPAEQISLDFPGVFFGSPIRIQPGLQDPLGLAANRDSET